MLAAIYLVLLVWSHYGRLTARPAKTNRPVIEVPAEGGTDRVSIALLERFPERETGAPLILIHGSPGSSGDFSGMVGLLNGRRRVIAPDLPGFGDSTRDVRDYSIRAHAGYVISMMDAMGIERAHLAGFSMGGGVVLNVCDLAPSKVESVVLLSAIGVQEMELLGDYRLNHAIHGLQLILLKMMHLLLPLSPELARTDISIPYARNFYDTDQRPLRGILRNYRSPMLIIHGRNDILVPVEAALEHHRIVPQSELVLADSDHFMVFREPAMPAERINGFLDRVETGRASTFDDARAERRLAAGRPFNPADLPRYVGITALVVMLLLAAATLVSEDLTCITAGIMASQGRLSFTLATLGCFAGIFVGDLLLYFAGRWIGRPALKAPPLKWIISAGDLDRSSEWFSRQGAKVILLSRFLPGTRLPSYFAAGAMETSFRLFAFYFLVACAIWTPMLVGLSMLLGGELVESSLGGTGLLSIVIAVLLIWIATRLLIKALTHRGRRLLVSTWRRLTRWEFWPAPVFYLPVAVRIALLMIRYRSLTVFTAANPAIPGGGFIDESKADILKGLAESPEFLPQWSFIDKRKPVGERFDHAVSFMKSKGLGYPIVLKPDAGQRGSGVAIIRDDLQLRGYLELADYDVLLQEFVSGDEFGIFYYRYPGDRAGRILAITEKRFPVVIGDGKRTLEQLILDDDRAICMAGYLLGLHASRLNKRIPAGREFRLVELGTHSRGAIFLDGGRIATPELEEAVDRISRRFEGFHFGRYDIRTGSLDELMAGRGFKVIELNGVTSEATSIYDPANSVFDAWRVLFSQWRIAFEIGDRNRKLGARPATPLELMASILRYRGKSTAHEPAGQSASAR